jgi:hypothetical protein
MFSRVERVERVEVLDRIDIIYRIAHQAGAGSGRRKCRVDECVANIYSETYTDPFEYSDVVGIKDCPQHKSMG